MLGLGHPAKEFGHDRLPVGCGQPIEGGDHFGCGATHVLVFYPSHFPPPAFLPPPRDLLTSCCAPLVLRVLTAAGWRAKRSPAAGLDVRPATSRGGASPLRVSSRVVARCAPGRPRSPGWRPAGWRGFSPRSGRSGCRSLAAGPSLSRCPFAVRLASVGAPPSGSGCPGAGSSPAGAAGRAPCARVRPVFPASLATACLPVFQDPTTLRRCEAAWSFFAALPGPVFDHDGRGGGVRSSLGSRGFLGTRARASCRATRVRPRRRLVWARGAAVAGCYGGGSCPLGARGGTAVEPREYARTSRRPALPYGLRAGAPVLGAPAPRLYDVPRGRPVLVTAARCRPPLPALLATLVARAAAHRRFPPAWSRTHAVAGRAHRPATSRRAAVASAHAFLTKANGTENRWAPTLGTPHTPLPSRIRQVYACWPGPPLRKPAPRGSVRPALAADLVSVPRLAGCWVSPHREDPSQSTTVVPLPAPAVPQQYALPSKRGHPREVRHDSISPTSTVLRRLSSRAFSTCPSGWSCAPARCRTDLLLLS